MSDLKAVVVRPSELTDDEVALWRRFLDQMPGVAPAFLSHAYACAAQRCFFDVRVAKLERGGNPVGYFPFQFRSRAHRALKIGERISGGLADYFGIIGAATIRLSGEELVRAIGLNLILFDHLDETQSAFGLNGDKPEPGLRIDIPHGGQAFWEEKRCHDKKFVQDTERRERKLIDSCGPLHFVFRHPKPEEELEKLIKAKREQYARTGVHDVLARPSTRTFLKTLTQMDDPQCCATLSTLHAGEKWVCSHFGLVCGETLHMWFPVYNPAMKAFAPGRLLLKSIIDRAEETGIKRIDRGAGDRKDKRDFATSEHLYYRGVWQRRGLVTLAYRAGLSAGWRLKSWQRHHRFSDLEPKAGR